MTIAIPFTKLRWLAIKLAAVSAASIPNSTTPSDGFAVLMIEIAWTPFTVVLKAWSVLVSAPSRLMLS